MVLSTHSAIHAHPDPGRITGYAIAIMINAAMLLLLLMPMAGGPPLAMPTSTTPEFRWIHRETPPPTPPVQVPVERPQPQHTQATTPAAVVTPPSPAPVLVEHGTEIAPDAVPAPVVATAAPTLAPVVTSPPGMRLEYLQAPPPAYPRAALHARSQGTVMLQVLVDVDGKPLQVDIQESSGDRRLDAAARDQVLRHWRFRPAMQDGRAVQALGLVPVAFNMNR